MRSPQDAENAGNVITILAVAGAIGCSTTHRAGRNVDRRGRRPPPAGGNGELGIPACGIRSQEGNHPQAGESAFTTVGSRLLRKQWRPGEPWGSGGERLRKAAAQAYFKAGAWSGLGSARPRWTAPSDPPGPPKQLATRDRVSSAVFSRRSEKPAFELLARAIWGGEVELGRPRSHSPQSMVDDVAVDVSRWPGLSRKDGGEGRASSRARRTEDRRATRLEGPSGGTPGGINRGERPSVGMGPEGDGVAADWPVACPHSTGEACASSASTPRALGGGARHPREGEP